MPSTLVGVVLLAAFVLPGYIIVRLSRRRRPYAPVATQLEVLLQSLGWALAVQLVAIAWTAELVGDLEGEGIDAWTGHVGEIAGYAGAVVLGVPIVVGMVLNRVLRRSEEGIARPGPLMELLGAGGPPQAWDKFGLHLARGGFVVARTADGAVVAGKLGERSWVSASPGKPDLILEEAWWADRAGNPVAPFEPRRVVWLNAERIDYLHAIPRGPEGGT